MDKHFIKVINRSTQIHTQTDGLFDVTLLPLMEAWGFTKRGMVPKEPSSKTMLEI